jgi:anti-anti-sigma regulatory factor
VTVWPSDKMDPVLEIWIDDGMTPATVRLHGLLDATTRSPLLSLMDELLDSGIRKFLIDIKDAYVCEACGVEVLALCQGHVDKAGGTVDWTGMNVDRHAKVAR